MNRADHEFVQPDAHAAAGPRPEQRVLRWLSSIVTAPFLLIVGLVGLIGTVSIRFALIGLPMLLASVALLVGPVLLARRDDATAGEIGAIALHVTTLAAMVVVYLVWEVDERDEWTRTIVLGLAIVGAVLAVARVALVARRRRP